MIKQEKKYELGKKYKDSSLNKLPLISVKLNLEFIAQTSERLKEYEFELKTIGYYYDYEEAKETFDKYSATESENMVYEIISLEFESGEPELDIDWDSISYEEEEGIVSDVSLEFLFSKNNEMISSYLYDKDNRGVNRLEG